MMACSRCLIVSARVVGALAAVGLCGCVAVGLVVPMAFWKPFIDDYVSHQPAVCRLYSIGNISNDEACTGCADQGLDDDNDCLTSTTPCLIVIVSYASVGDDVFKTATL